MTEEHRQELIDALMAMIPPAPPPRYYRQDEDGYLFAVGVGLDGQEIAEETYMAIREMIEGRPAAPAGYEYRLTSGLQWVLCEQPAPEESELDPAEALELICGSSRLTKRQAAAYRENLVKSGAVAEKPAASRTEP